LKENASEIDPDQDFHGFFLMKVLFKIILMFQKFLKKGQKHKMIINPERFKISTAGFQSPNGNSTAYTANYNKPIPFWKSITTITCIKYE
jgi:hypothetical protein